MDKDHIRIVLKRDGISPDELPFKQLSKIIESYFRTITAIAYENNPKMDMKSVKYCLSSISSGSVDTLISSPVQQLFAKANCELVDGFRSNNIEMFPDNVQEDIYDFCENMEQFGLTADLYSDPEHTVQLIPAEFFRNQRTIEDITTIYGELIAVGGAKPNINIHLSIPERKRKLICKITESDAKILGSRLYTTVGVYGKAIRKLPSMEILKFTVMRVTDYSEEDRAESIAKLRKIFSDCCKDIDLDQMLNNIRG